MNPDSDLLAVETLADVRVEKLSANVRALLLSLEVWLPGHHAFAPLK